jgi:hypothetical protein
MNGTILTKQNLQLLKNKLMKHKTLVITFILAVVFVATGISNSVFAGTIPTVRGRVITTAGRPISGVWVSMTSSGCPNCVECLQKQATRYAQTDANGEFTFSPVYTPNYSQPGGTCASNPEIGKMIDTDLDGVNDAEMIPAVAPGCTDTENGKSWTVCTYEFGCWGSSYSFTVVKPFNWQGSFDTISGVTFNNADHDFTIFPGEITYHDPTASVTPTSIPTDQTFTNEPSFPRCLTSSVLQFGGGDSDLCRTAIASCPTRSTSTFVSTGGNGTVKIYTGMGHRWDKDCAIGPNNDSDTKTQCDQADQTFEALKVFVNDTEVGQTVDLGTDTIGYWEFPATLAEGQNKLELRHIIENQQLSSNSESVFYKGSVCEDSGSGEPTGSASCSVSLPSAISLSVGETKTISPNLRETGGSVDEMTFLISNSLASVCNTTLSSCPRGNLSYRDAQAGFGANVTGYTQGNVIFTVAARMIDEGVSCISDSSTIQVLSSDAWWQVKEGDVMTNGNVLSEIPTSCSPSLNCDAYFITNDSDNDPGIPVTGGNFSVGSSSTKGWLVEGSRYLGTQPYNFSFFESKTDMINSVNVNSSTMTQASLSTGGILHEGYEYYFYDGRQGDISLSGNITVGDRKIILIVDDADVLVDGNISLNDGNGFFMLVSSKGISINETVDSIEGLYFTDGIFKTNSDNTGDEQLVIRGAVVADSVKLTRSLTNNSIAASEVIEYAPDQYLLYPSSLAQPFLVWKEIQP